ncbi:MAG: hypothetical protein NWT08_13990, partial [Akkermansiaceae bacterium]|nr:hypothetical protein [Akkermansiaceae bacterium]
PILNGASLIRQIITTNPNTAVIAASGIAAQEESAIAAGCKPGNFLMKPFLTEDLLFTLQRALTK